MYDVITDSVSRGGCQEGQREWRRRRRVKKNSQLKLKNATKWNKDECSTEPQTEYKRQSCEIYMAARRAEQNAKLRTPPVTGPEPEPQIIWEHLGIRPTAAICPVEHYPAYPGNKRQKAIAGKKASPIFNTIWCYFSLSVMPLLLQIGLAVKGIDCEPEPQPGQKRGKARWRVWCCYQQVICVCLKKPCSSSIVEGVIFQRTWKLAGCISLFE